MFFVFPSLLVCSLDSDLRFTPNSKEAPHVSDVVIPDERMAATKRFMEPPLLSLIGLSLSLKNTTTFIVQPVVCVCHRVIYSGTVAGSEPANTWRSRNSWSWGDAGALSSASAGGGSLLASLLLSSVEFGVLRRSHAVAELRGGDGDGNGNGTCGGETKAG
jgi:hypothetical protein